MKTQTESEMARLRRDVWAGNQRIIVGCAVLFVGLSWQWFKFNMWLCEQIGTIWY